MGYHSEPCSFWGFPHKKISGLPLLWTLFHAGGGIHWLEDDKKRPRILLIFFLIIFGILLHCPNSKPLGMPHCRGNKAPQLKNVAPHRSEVRKGSPLWNVRGWPQCDAGLPVLRQCFLRDDLGARGDQEEALVLGEEVYGQLEEGLALDAIGEHRDLHGPDLLRCPQQFLQLLPQAGGQTAAQGRGKTEVASQTKGSEFGGTLSEAQP